MNQYGGFLIAPFPAAILGTAITYVTGGSLRPTSVLLFYLLIFYAAQLLIGIPLRLSLQRRGETEMGSFALAGLTMIAIPVIPFMILSMFRHGYSWQVPAVIAVWLFLGTLIGLTFWWLTRPDKPRPHP